jgi:hypothetical protein
VQQAAAFHRAVARLAVGVLLRERLLVPLQERPLALLLVAGVLLPVRPLVVAGVLRQDLRLATLPARHPVRLLVVATVRPDRLPAAAMAHPVHLLAVATVHPDRLPAAAMAHPAHLPVAAMVPPARLLEPRPAVATARPALRPEEGMARPELRPAATVLPELHPVATVLPGLRLDQAGALLLDPVVPRPAPSAAASFLLVGRVVPERLLPGRQVRGRPPTRLGSVGTRSPRISSASASRLAQR